MKKIKISLFLAVLGFSVILLSRCERVLDEVRSELLQAKNKIPTTGTVTDIDGNVYKTVTIGSQVWMAENLKTTHYQNGDPIPNIKDLADWEYHTGAYCNYNNDVSNVDIYGRLYNVAAENEPRNIAPPGYHVPIPAELTTLIEFLGGTDVAGGKLKESGTVHWLSPNVGATNEYGFTALPNGYRGNGGEFIGLGSEGDYGTAGGIIINWYYFFPYFLSSYNSKISLGPVLDGNLWVALAIRCLKNSTPVITNTFTASFITGTTARSGGDIEGDGGAAITARGVCWHTSHNPTIKHSKTIDGEGVGSFTSIITGLKQKTTYYVRSYATNNIGTAYGNEIMFKTADKSITDLNETVTDIEGNVYKTVKIGTQTWMAENLKTTKYNDGSTIPYATGDNHLPSFYWLNNDSLSYKNVYGTLYNWYAVNTNKLAPSGWHVPTYSEWNTLINFIGGEAAGGKLKETGTTHWQSPNTGATNESGFTALQGGLAYFISGSIYNYTLDGSWWTSTEYGLTIYGLNAWNVYLHFDSANIDIIHQSDEGEWFSVRCIKD